MHCGVYPDVTLTGSLLEGLPRILSLRDLKDFKSKSGLVAAVSLASRRHQKKLAFVTFKTHAAVEKAPRTVGVFNAPTK